ncbi:hypothetical protein BS50DRAFT_493886, partial [Corynespora cassiicola Philippines]
AAIVFIFTVATLINRRRRRRNSLPNDLKVCSPTSKLVSPSIPQAGLPDNSRFRTNLTSRFLSKFPFLLEIWYWNLTYWTYQLARAYSATLIRTSPTAHATAINHARSILHLEQRIGIALELPTQRFILDRTPWLMPLLARVYYSHIVVGILFIVYTYMSLPHGTYTRVRRTIAVNNMLAFVILTAWRCAPPRLMPREYGFVDVLHPPPPGQPTFWNNNPFQLTIAAMPSLHFGTSLYLCLCLVHFSPHRPLRLLAPLWPAAMLLTILATANHWVLDAVVGACIPFIGWRLHWIFDCEASRRIEQWGFWLLKTEKPRVRAGSEKDEDFREEAVRRKDGAWMA